MKRWIVWMLVVLFAGFVLYMYFVYIRPKLAMEEAVAGLESHYGISVQVHGSADRAEAGRVLYGIPLVQVMNDFCRKDHLVWWREEDGQYNIATRRYYESCVICRHPSMRTVSVPNTPVFAVRIVCGAPKYFDRSYRYVYSPRAHKAILTGRGGWRVASALQALDRFCDGLT